MTRKGSMQVASNLLLAELNDRIAGTMTALELCQPVPNIETLCH